MTEVALASPAVRGVKSTLIEFFLAALLGVSAGAAFEAANPRSRAPLTANEAATLSPVSSTVLDLAPIVTNLGSPPEVWIRLEASMVFDPKTMAHPDAVAAKIADDILSFLRTVSLKQLEGPIGLEGIREDLNDRARTRSEGKVKELVIRTLVVQ